MKIIATVILCFLNISSAFATCTIYEEKKDNYWSKVYTCPKDEKSEDVIKQAHSDAIAAKKEGYKIGSTDFFPKDNDNDVYSFKWTRMK